MWRTVDRPLRKLPLQGWFLRNSIETILLYSALWGLLNLLYQPKVTSSSATYIKHICLGHALCSVGQLRTQKPLFYVVNHSTRKKTCCTQEIFFRTGVISSRHGNIANDVDFWCKMYDKQALYYVIYYLFILPFSYLQRKLVITSIGISCYIIQ